jgi:hypothetical protein
MEFSFVYILFLKFLLEKHVILILTNFVYQVVIPFSVNVTVPKSERGTGARSVFYVN